ncbi:TIGR02269 family lipoprotein [Archangium sp.]|uniref:SitA6 family polymorphic toxin lipoprotein n=1 Tax=Archangium sp. TaxID=1872627 RepID=UPI00389AD991
MNLPNPGKWLALLGLLLSACVTSAPTARGEEETPETVSDSWEEARADPSCVVPLCDGERCALWRCQDVVEVESHPVLLAQAMAPAQAPILETAPMLRSPWVDNPSRWWGVPLGAPVGREPVFEIPWHNWREKERERLAQKTYRHFCIQGPYEPYEKHHIFPQQKELAEWFDGSGIDIHAFTIRLPRSFHQWLHSGGPQGGQWNEAWRQFAIANRTTATPEDIWRFAGELMMRFGVNGPLVPYHCD